MNPEPREKPPLRIVSGDKSQEYGNIKPVSSAEGLYDWSRDRAEDESVGETWTRLLDFFRESKQQAEAARVNLLLNLMDVERRLALGGGPGVPTGTSVELPLEHDVYEFLREFAQPDLTQAPSQFDTGDTKSVEEQPDVTAAGQQGEPDSIPPSLEENAMPDEQKYFEKYLDSRLSSIENTMKHEVEKIEVIASNLSKNVDRALTESAAMKKEFYDGSRWSMRLLVGSVLGVLALFAALLYFMLNVSNNVSRDTIELRKEFYQAQQNIQKELQKMQLKKQ